MVELAEEMTPRAPCLPFPRAFLGGAPPAPLTTGVGAGLPSGTSLLQTQVPRGEVRAVPWGCHQSAAVMMSKDSHFNPFPGI